MEETPVPKHLPTIGWREWAGLPEFGIGAIKAKVDTGARTSALHAYKIVPFRRAGAAWIRFELHPLQRSDAMKVVCEAPTIDERTVRNSGGGVEHRYIIRTQLQLGDKSWPIELALANRDQMGFRLLLGRTALEDRVLVEPGRSYLLGTRRTRARPRRKLTSLKAGKLRR
ncbi:MAG TPA: ATP-dependent zinc protease [Methyloceanibacter sp.]|nr:ATP-dependent zinc protease [Methyloceanibacter sp.]